MKKLISTILFASFIHGCTHTQKTVAGGVTMGVGGAIAGVSGINLATNENLKNISGGAYEPNNATWQAGITTGALMFAVGTIILISGIDERNKTLQKRKGRRKEKDLLFDECSDRCNKENKKEFSEFEKCVKQC